MIINHLSVVAVFVLRPTNRTSVVPGIPKNVSGLVGIPLKRGASVVGR